MDKATKKNFLIRVSLGTEIKGVSTAAIKKLYYDLKEDIKRASASIPPELKAQMHVQTNSSSATKSSGEIEAILVALMMGTYAVKPIFNFMLR